MTTRFTQQHTFDFTGSVTDPELGALLLVKVVDHDFMLDVVNEHGAPVGAN